VTLGSFRILHGATLAVSRGSTTGIIGPNGAGKSSLLNAVCGYYPVSTGSVEFNGVDTTHARMSKMSRLGVRRSFQHVPLVEALTLREYVSLGYEAGRSDFVPLAVIPSPLVERSSRTALREAGEWLGELGLSEFADRAMAETSYAARKLADIARAFMNSPVLVLLDEPTSGVADEHRPVIGNVITQAQSRTGATVVIVDHDVRFISDLVDHMVAMDSGRVIASGEASAVLSDEMVLTSFIGKQSAAKRGPMEAAEVRQSDQ
jgi:ABC-type branched-subunit amino acid transport system ATPase component